MSYQVLARKWRPHQFRDVVGQSHVLTAISNALEQNRLHHAYLFSGTRGVGKTTIARIFSKALNCEQGMSASPCGVCSTCQEIDQGRYVDLLEIDAASRTKVEDTRELLDNVQYKPARGRFKVYLIDEVHMLSRNSFNALLKTLEEPPEYVKFLLATTDPQKLPVTILSRCLQFHLKHLDAEQIKNQLTHVLAQEQIPSESRALSLIARSAEGSMRDALSLTDQAIALGNGQVNTSNVAEMLGTLSTDQAILLLEALSEQAADPLMQCVGVLAEVGIEWDGLLKELAAQLHQLAMIQALPESIDKMSPDKDRLLHLAHVFSPQDIQLFYQIVLQGRQDLPYAPDGRAGLEMVLLRMLAFKPVTSAVYQAESISVPQNEPVITPSCKGKASSGADHLSRLKSQIMSTSSTVSSTSEQVNSGVKTENSSQQAGLSTAPTECDYIPNSSATDMPDHQSRINDGRASPSSIPDLAQHSEDVTEHQEQKIEQKNTLANSGSAAINNLTALRSSMNRFQKDKTGKKIEAVPASSPSPMNVIDRIAERHKPLDRQLIENTMVPTTTISKDDGYRWQPTQQDENATTEQLVTPELIKSALEHEKTPEMKARLEQEAMTQDLWCKLTSELQVSQLVKQLALNAAMSRENNEICLTLRAEQAHLLSTRAQSELTYALKQSLGDEIQLTIVTGSEGMTPLEWRNKLYEEKLIQANNSLKNDPNVVFICQRFNASIDENSIRPL